MTDKATPTPSPASVDSVMAKAMMLVGALDDSCEEATSLPFLEAVTALRAEVERLAAQSAPSERDAKDAARYRLLRRGQKWSTVDGIGTVLRAETLDAAIDAAMAKD